jgi:hypothetical protein
LLELTEEIDHVPMFRQPTVAQAMDVDPRDTKGSARGRDTHEFTHVGAAIGPSNYHPIAFSYHVFQGEAWLERIPQHFDPLLESVESTVLPRNRVVLVIFRDCNFVKQLDIPRSQDLLVIPADDSFVLFGWHGSAPSVGVVISPPA